jgi:hypothetical protein
MLRLLKQKSLMLPKRLEKKHLIIFMLQQQKKLAIVVLNLILVQLPKSYLMLERLLKLQKS